MSTRWSLALYGMTCLLFATWAFLPDTWDTSGPFDPVQGHRRYETIVILSPLVTTGFMGASAALALSMLILAFLAYQWPVIRFPAIALLLAIFAFPAAGLWHMVSNFGPWTMHGRVTDAKGQQFVFCDSSFLQGQTMALGKLDAQNVLFTRLKVLGTNNGDSPRSWASVIRPANPTNTYGQLYLTTQQMLVGIRFDNNCYFACDLPNEKFIGYTEIEAVSPFLCLGENDTLNPDDVEAVRKTIAEEKPGTPGYPHRDAIASGLEHPNPRVKELAATLLQLVGTRQPEPNR